jgi:hypothetical protein
MHDNELLKDKSSNNYYDKVRHLVEVDDDILAVFISEHSQIRDLHIAKNAKIDEEFINSISGTLKSGDGNGDATTEKRISDGNRPLGRLKWVVSEYENIRILKIIEGDKTVVVVVNSNTQLQHTIDNILGYYYDDTNEIPKSLF